MKSDVYNKEGKKAGSVALPEVVFGVAWNPDLVHQVVMALESNMRTPVAHTKDRSDVSGTGKKPWRQKGTGRSRHGSRRSPIWRTGGVAHGPRNEKKYGQKTTKKMRAKALFSALSQKLRDGEVLFVDELGLTAPKTKDAKAVLEALSKVKGFEGLTEKKHNAALVALAPNLEDVNAGKDDAGVAAARSFNNFGNIEVEEVRNLNARDVLKSKYVIITNPDASVEFLASKGAKSKE